MAFLAVFVDFTFLGKVTLAVITISVLFAFAVKRAAVERDAEGFGAAKLLRTALIMVVTALLRITSAIFSAIVTADAFGVIKAGQIAFTFVTTDQHAGE